MEITQENILQVIVNNGGKIANKALVRQFKKALNGSNSADNQAKFKKIINEIAVVQKDSKGRNVVVLKKEEPADESKQPDVVERPTELPTSSGQNDEKVEKMDEAPAESPVAEVEVPVDTANSPSGEKVRERAKMFESPEKQSQERDTPSCILRSATDEKAVVCASGHAEEDNTISLDDVKRKWMMMSAKCDYQGMARFLQDHKHLVGWKNFCNGYTALHYAAKFGEQDCIKMLAGKYKANVNAINQAGMTPLHMAAMHNRGPAIQLLVQTYKADPNIRDYRGKLPKDYLTDNNTRRMSLHGYDDTLNNAMLLDTEEPISASVRNYLKEGYSGGTMRFDTGTMDGAVGGTLKASDAFSNSNILRRSFRVGTGRAPTMAPEYRMGDTLRLEDQMKGSYAGSMKRTASSPVSRAMSLPKARPSPKKHIKNQKKFTSMIEEVAEENES